MTFGFLLNFNERIIAQLNQQKLSLDFIYNRMFLLGLILLFIGPILVFYFEEINFIQLYFELFLSFLLALTSIISKLLTVHGEIDVLNIYSFFSMMSLIIVSLALPYYWASIPLLLLQFYVFIYYSKFKG